MEIHAALPAPDSAGRRTFPGSVFQVFQISIQFEYLCVLTTNHFSIKTIHHVEINATSFAHNYYTYIHCGNGIIYQWHNH